MRILTFAMALLGLLAGCAHFPALRDSSPAPIDRSALERARDWQKRQAKAIQPKRRTEIAQKNGGQAIAKPVEPVAAAPQPQAAAAQEPAKPEAKLSIDDALAKAEKVLKRERALARGERPPVSGASSSW